MAHGMNDKPVTSYTVHTPSGTVRCVDLRLAAKVRAALGGHVAQSAHVGGYVR